MRKRTKCGNSIRTRRLEKPGDRGFMILPGESLAVSRPSWKVPGIARKGAERRVDERRRASRRTGVTHVKTQHTRPKMSAFTMATAGTSAAVPVSPPVARRDSATFRDCCVNTKAYFLSSWEHDVARAPRGLGDGISRVDAPDHAAAVPKYTHRASLSSSGSSATIGSAASVREKRRRVTDRSPRV